MKLIRSRTRIDAAFLSANVDNDMLVGHVYKIIECAPSPFAIVMSNDNVIAIELVRTDKDGCSGYRS